MNKLFDQLYSRIQNLNNARRIHDQNRIAKGYKQIASTLNELYKTTDVTTTLKTEKILIASEQNGIDKTSKTHKTITDHLDRIGRAEIADTAQKKSPRQYHTGALIDHATLHYAEGTSNDTIRIALSKCREEMKRQISAMSAEDMPSRRQCHIIRYDGLVNAERAYMERQVEYRAKYATPEIKKQAQQNTIKAFDAKIRVEQRQLKLTPQPEQTRVKSRGNQQL